MTKLQENWKPIPNYEGIYEVSNFGTVRSLTRTVKIGINYRTIESQILQPRLNKGYHQMILCKGSKHKTFKVHRLVAFSFIANPESRTEVNHKDGNKINNHVSNLEWNWPSENRKHCWRTGLMPITAKMSERSRINGKKAPKGTNSKKVINNKTGEVFDSVGLAALSINMTGQTLSRKLVGSRKNDTCFSFASISHHSS